MENSAQNTQLLVMSRSREMCAADRLSGVNANKPILYLCGGLQSSGSTLVSWCFLQRKDMDGVLDAFHDQIFAFPKLLESPFHWCKFTISAFRFSELITYYTDEGFEVRPLLLLRDPRAVFQSLATKPYGRNGLTAEDPPLRLRLLRFLGDWELFRDRTWPIVKFEDFVAKPLQSLKETCERLGLPWDDAMVSWPKTKSDIAHPINGNQRFVDSLQGGLEATLQREASRFTIESIHEEDLAWLETTFSEFLRENGYPAHIPPQAPLPPGRLMPTRAVTRRSQTERDLYSLWTERDELAAVVNAHPILRPLIWLRPYARKVLRRN